VGLTLLAAIAAGGASARNYNPITHNTNAESPPDVSQLIRQLKSPDTRERIRAALELDKIKPLPPAAIKPLLEMLRTTPSNGAQYAIKPLSAAGPRVIPPLAAMANAGNEPAVWTLGMMAFSEPSSWPILIGLFKSEDNGIRMAVPSQLARAGPPVVPLLIKALKDDDPHMRAGAANTFAQMGHMPGNSVGVRYCKPEDLAPAAPQLAKLLSDPDSEGRDKAALALAYVDPSDKRAAPILAQILDRSASYEVMEALRNMGSNARDAVPALARVLASDTDPLMCVWAARTLGKIGGTETCASLTEAIVGSNNDQARRWITDVTNSINDVRVEAADAIVKITPACPQTIPTLTATLGKPWGQAARLRNSAALPYRRWRQRRKTRT
jgi:HEAT repeat protein